MKVDADKIGNKTWVARWQGADGVWVYVKAPRMPKLNAKFMTKGEAIREASYCLQINLSEQTRINKRWKR